MESPKGRFKVIIVGGGPNGLTAAHALHKANIDFVVLERRPDIVFDQGASLVLGPGSLRVMQQLGLYENLTKISAGVNYNRAFLRDGTEYKTSRVLEVIARNHGTTPAAFHRAHLLQAIYDGLPEESKARYLLNKSVESITTNDNGATVKCTDGSEYEGDMVLGVDGVHSKTRRLMRGLALAEDPKLEAEWDEESPFPATYRSMWCSFPRPEKTPPGQGCETTHKDLSIMYLAGTERAWIFLYEKLPGPTHDRHDYTDADVDAFAERFADWPIDEALKVRDVYAAKLTAGMADLQEGIAKHWTWGGRIAIAGDAAHKFMPNAGLGFNNGIQDVVVLCNALRETIAKANAKTKTAGDDKQHPSPDALQKMLEEYETRRRKEIQGDARQSAMTGRLHAWPNNIYFFFARHILKHEPIQKIMVTKLLAPALAKAPVLDYVSAEEPFQGKRSWKHKMPSPVMAK